MGRYSTPRESRTTFGGAGLAEVAAELGMSRERVRQIERQALAKARALLAARGLTIEHFLDAVQRDRHDCGVDPATPEWR